MKRLFCILAIASLTLTLSGCGGGGSSPPPPIFESRILSNPTYDGDITYDGSIYDISQGGLASVFAGIDPDPANGSETRAFLNFSLSAVPSNAFINSAKLDLFINSFSSFYTKIPIRIELVPFAPYLGTSDYNTATLATVTSDIFLSDVGKHVLIDVTPLVAKAQSLGLVNFHIRILEDFGFVNPGLFEINDATISKAPLLDIIYQLF